MRHLIASLILITSAVAVLVPPTARAMALDFSPTPVGYLTLKASDQACALPGRGGHQTVDGAGCGASCTGALGISSEPSSISQQDSALLWGLIDDKWSTWLNAPDPFPPKYLS